MSNASRRLGLGVHAHMLEAELEAAMADPLAELADGPIQTRSADPVQIAGGYGRSGEVEDAVSHGSRDSGSAVVPFGGVSSGVLRASLPQHMRTGLASVHVCVSDFGPRPAGDIIGHRIELTVRWQTGVAGGECRIDATRGAHFTVGGLHSIEIDARSVNPGPAATFRPTNAIPKLVEAVVHWQGAVSPKPCYVVSERIALVAAVESAHVVIPAQAESMLILSDVPASLPALRALFHYDAVAGAPVAYETLNPNANGTPMVGGVESVTFISPAVPMIITPVFETYL